MRPLAWAANAAVFGLELVAFGGIGVGVWRLVDHPGWRWVAAIAAVGLVITLWARAAAPTASVSGAVRWSVRVGVFATAAVLLALTVGVWLGVGFAAVSVLAWWLATALPTPPELVPQHAQAATR